MMSPDEIRLQAVKMHFNALDQKRGILDRDSYLQRVEKYYDHVTPTILEQFGLTYQIGVRSTDQRENNLFFGKRAGLVDGFKVLDAGCGWGGPAIHLAQEYEKIQIVGVTISERQRDVMNCEIKKVGLQDRVSAVKCNFHSLPFLDDEFDLVYFFESAGHSEHPLELFREVLRVLRPGGSLYIKEPFLQSDRQRVDQAAEIEAMESIFQYKMASLNEVVTWVEEAGFDKVRGQDISSYLSFDGFWSAMRDTQGSLTAFGREHLFPLAPMKLIMGEVLAMKPLE